MDENDESESIGRPDDDAQGSLEGEGAESPEEGHAAMEQAEEATVDDG
jgi:hypothetical protein